MKKLMVLLAGLGLGLILAATCFENSLAEERVFTSGKGVYSGDSLSVLSLKQRAERNFQYLKPGPAKPLKVVGEFLSGGAGAVLGGAIGGGIGYYITKQERGDGAVLDFSGLEGAGIGYLIASPFACALGVYIIGNIGEDKGSYPATLGGSIVGTLLGLGIISSMVKGEGPDEPAVPAFVLFTVAQAAGATAGFNLFRKKKVEASSGAMLSLNNGKLSLTFPQVNLSTDSKRSSSYKVNLFQAKF